MSAQEAFMDNTKCKSQSFWPWSVPRSSPEKNVHLMYKTQIDLSYLDYIAFLVESHTVKKIFNASYINIP